MNSFFKLFPTFFCFLILLFNFEVRGDTKLEVNYMNGEGAGMPFQYLDNSGKKGGIITDIIMEIFNNKNYNLKINLLPLSRYDAEVKRYGENKPNSLKRLVAYNSPDWVSKDFPLVFSKQDLFVMKSVLIMNAKKSFKFNKIDDLYGKTLILIHGFDYPGIDDHLEGKNKIPNEKINAIRVQNNIQALKLLLDPTRDVDAYIDLEPRVKWIIKEQNLGPKNFAFEDISNIIKPVPVRLVFTKDFPENELNEIDSKIIQLTNSGKINSILKKYQ